LSVQILNILKNTGIEIITSVKQLLEKAGKKIVIVPHENPDGDAIGSAIGLAEILVNYGHHVQVISPNNYPGFLKWFTSEINIVIYDNYKKKAKKIIENADVLICVDFNDAKRAARLEKHIFEFKKQKLLIDHHPNPVEFCDFTISEPTYSSTAELIYDVAKLIGFEKYINRNAAEALFTGIMTDTGSFSHNISNPNTFSVVAELMKLGISTKKIQSNVYHNFSASRMKLLGYCLNEKMEVFPELRSAVISISKKELEQFNFEPGDTEGFVNYPLSINNIVFSALFIEKEGLVKASFRSNGNFAANQFSQNHFEGGGHLNAAGGESKMSLNKTTETFKQLLGQYKHQLLETII
jgi:bifunctional oligoribonuclease and PAP phosphatase NrnA